MVISNGIDYDAFSQIPLKEPDGWIDIGAVVRLAQLRHQNHVVFFLRTSSASAKRSFAYHGWHR